MMPTAVRFAAATTIFFASSAFAGTETWNFDIITEGQDVIWTSPTSVNPDAPQYDGAYVLNLIEVGISWNGIPLGTVDVTNEVPRELRQGQEVVDGPAPIVLLDGQVVYPAPPEPPAIDAMVRVELNASGFGVVSLTEVTLGTLDVEVPPFGMQTVQITSIRVAGSLDITPLTPLGDLNNDGVVNVSDLLILLSQWGPCNGTCPADLNDDEVVNVSDLLVLLANWG